MNDGNGHFSWEASGIQALIRDDFSRDGGHQSGQAPRSQKQGTGFGLDLKQTVVSILYWLSSNSDFSTAQIMVVML